jgi:hypothetical protein
MQEHRAKAKQYKQRGNMKILMLCFATCMAAVLCAQEKPLDASAARDAIVQLNKVWGKARVDYDRNQMEKMLAPDFYVQIGKQRISRKEFIDENAQRQPTVVLKRFDVQVLTVQPTPEGAWLAVIAERLQAERTAPDGKKIALYSLWITKDTWKQEKGQWQALSSEAAGFQYWRQGQKPPKSVWG